MKKKSVPAKLRCSLGSGRTSSLAPAPASLCTLSMLRLVLARLARHTTDTVSCPE